MKAYKIIWTRSAAKERIKLLEWYLQNTSAQFVETIEKNLDSTIELLSHSPGIGRIEKIEKSKTYRSFLTHPKTRIHYRYDENNLYILHLVSTMMNR